MKYINNYIQEKLHITKDYKVESELADNIFHILNLREKMKTHKSIKVELEKWVKDNEVKDVEVITNFQLEKNQEYINRNWANIYWYDYEYYKILHTELFDDNNWKKISVSVVRDIYYNDKIMEYYIDSKHSIIIHRYDKNK